MVGTKNGFVVTWLTNTNFQLGWDLMKLSAASAPATAPKLGLASTADGTVSAAAPRPARLSRCRRSSTSSRSSSGLLGSGCSALRSSNSTACPPFPGRRSGQDDGNAANVPRSWQEWQAISLSYDERPDVPPTRPPRGARPRHRAAHREGRAAARSLASDRCRRRRRRLQDG